MKALNLILFILLMTQMRCTNSTDNIPLLNYDYNTPEVTGIIITFEDSPAEMGRWGVVSQQQNNGKANPSNLNISNPYPNPCAPFVFIDYSINSNSKVSVFIVRARGPGNVDNNLELYNLSVCINPIGKAIRVFYRDENRSIGPHSLFWDGKDDQGLIVPEGFYRVYVQVGSYLAWKDILLFHDSEKIRLFFSLL